MKYTVLYNPDAGNGKWTAYAEKLKASQGENELDFRNMQEIKSYAKLFEEIADGNLLIVGGDGTLNRFINDTASLEIANKVFYCACGSGNDFLHDIGGVDGEITEITDYIKNLPSVTVNGKTYKFLNGVGYGIDGYCCEVGDEQRKIPNKKVNYAGIAIKGLLFHFKPRNAVITVDGQAYEYKKVWLAPTMNGRFYGGGMDVAPDQKRNSGIASCVVMYGSGKLKTLIVFPSIFKGEHVNHKEMVAIHTGKEITVKFDKPTALQIDGETILGVTEYTARV